MKNSVITPPLYLQLCIYINIHKEGHCENNTSKRKNHFTIPLFACSLENFTDNILIFPT